MISIATMIDAVTTALAGNNQRQLKLDMEEGLLIEQIELVACLLQLTSDRSIPVLLEVTPAVPGKLEPLILDMVHVFGNVQLTLRSDLKPGSSSAPNDSFLDGLDHCYA